MFEKPTTQEQQQVSTEREFMLEAVAELEEPIKKIIEKIKSRIEAGEYGIIIGDDASGRIPALILGNFIKKVSEARGLSKPNIIFIPGKLTKDMPGGDFVQEGQRIERIQEFDDYLSEHGADKNKKVLIVTDTVQSGGSLSALVDLLNKSGYVAEIVTIGLEFEDDEKMQKRRKRHLKNTEIISGEYRRSREPVSRTIDNTPMIYGKHELGGVKKIEGDDKSKPTKVFETYGKQGIQHSINQAREDAAIITDSLFNWYESQKHEK